jgi:hypothetical protein
MKFLANRLQTAYPQTWAKMNAARTPAEAAETFTREYERPAARYLNARINKIRSQGVPSVEQQLGPRASAAPNTQLAMRGDIEPGGSVDLPEIRVTAPDRGGDRGPSGNIGKLPRKDASPTSDIGKLPKKEEGMADTPKKKTKPKGMKPAMKKQIQARQRRLVEIPGTPTGLGRGTTSYYVDQ